MPRKENWKKVKEYPNYEVSDTGRVRSTDRIGSDPPRRSWFIHGVLLKPWHANGYKKIGLWNEQGRRVQYVHILVAQAFIPNPKHLPEVNHKDEIKTNCRVRNLEWRSSAGNVQHSAYKQGDGVQFCKERANQRKPWMVIHQGKYVGRFETLDKARAEKAKLKEVL